MNLYGYKVLQTKDGPMVSDSSTSIYEIYLTSQEYDDFYAICVFHNLNPLQVEVALDYIKKNRDQLEAELPKWLKKKAETESHHRVPAANHEELVTCPSVLRERKAGYVVREKDSENSNGNSRQDYGYEILETENGPMVGESRTSVYDIMLSQQEGESFYAMCVIHNLKQPQVEAALAYIDKNRERLEADLPTLLVKKAENEHYHRAIAAERKKIPVKMTPQRQAFYELRNRHLNKAASNGTNHSQ